MKEGARMSSEHTVRRGCVHGVDSSENAHLSQGGEKPCARRVLVAGFRNQKEFSVVVQF